MVKSSNLKSNRRISKIALLTIVLLSLTYLIVFAYAKKGGTLYIKEDDSWIPVEKFYDVLPGQTYDLKVCDVPEELGDVVFIKVSSSDDDGWTDHYNVGEPRCVEFTWTSPSDAYYATFVVQLKKAVQDDPYMPKGPTYIVEGSMEGEDKPAHLRVVPAYVFGTAMTALAAVSGIGAYSKSRKK